MHSNDPFVFAYVGFLFDYFQEGGVALHVDKNVNKRIEIIFVSVVFAHMCVI